MDITLTLKDEKHGNTQDAWQVIHQSLKPNLRNGWTEKRIQKDLANGSVIIPFSDEKDSGNFLNTFEKKGGRKFFNIQ